MHWPMPKLNTKFTKFTELIIWDWFHVDLVRIDFVSSLRNDLVGVDLVRIGLRWTLYIQHREKGMQQNPVIETGYWVQLLQGSGYRYWLSMTGYFNIQVTGYSYWALGTEYSYYLFIYKISLYLWQHAHFLCTRDRVQPQNLSHYLKPWRFFFNGETCWNPREKTIQCHTPPVHPSSFS